MARVTLATAALLVALLGVGDVSAQESGWRIDRFDAIIRVEPDGKLLITERIDVAFDEERRGIIRDIPVRYAYDESRDRLYELDLISVHDAAGADHPFEVIDESPVFSIRIGDADVFLTGAHTYEITYEVDGAVNTFPDHYEVYWNVNGPWPVAIDSASATVTLDGGGITGGQCFAGVPGSTEACGGALVDADSAGFGAGRVLAFEEQLTVVVAIDPNALIEPALFLEERDTQRGTSPDEFMGIGPANVIGSVAIFLAGLAILAVNWWREGRDRAYKSLYYLTNDPAENRRPLFARRDVVIEYTPPESLKPAMMGLILDERADERDLTATIIDLAVRGHLTITETQTDGWFRDADWRLDKQTNHADALAPYEHSLYEGVFGAIDSVQLSRIEPERYGPALQRAQDELYDDSVKQRWFPTDPDNVRWRWRGFATIALIAGVAAIVFLGARFGVGLLGVPIAALSIPLFLGAGAMPRRTAHGSEMLRRILGFRLYIETAEKHRAEFAEKAHLFTEYLPYAIVFGSVDKWASVFAGIDVVDNAGWYSGSNLHALTTTAFSSKLHGLSAGLGSVAHASSASTPGGSGMSGFSFGGGFSGGGGGGFSGGGGGGGGGRSW